MEEKLQRLEEAILKCKEKDFGIYFFTVDTKGAAAAGVANIYKLVKTLNELGYRASILHEKEEFTSVESWLGEDYAMLPHISIEGQELKVSPQDMIIFPEAYGVLLKQVKNYPCKKIILAQSYDYALDMLTIGDTWDQMDAKDVITTSENQKNHIASMMPECSYQVIPPYIFNEFFNNENKEPKKPIIAISSRDPRVKDKIIKSFYLKYPQFRWVSFKDMVDMSIESFAANLDEACLSVWVDDTAGFGTFPIESMKMNVPVIGKVPTLVPEWMLTTNEEGKETIANNGIWVNDEITIPDAIASYIKLYFEDNEPEELFKEMEETASRYNTEDYIQTVSDVFSNLTNKRIDELVNAKETISKLSEEELEEMMNNQENENL